MSGRNYGGRERGEEGSVQKVQVARRRRRGGEEEEDEEEDGEEEEERVGSDSGAGRARRRKYRAIASCPKTRSPSIGPG